MGYKVYKLGKRYDITIPIFAPDYLIEALLFLMQ
jgi:hypothetical protein